MSPYMRALLARNMDTTYVLLICNTEYFTLNERWLRIELVTSDTMSKNQFNQKF